MLDIERQYLELLNNTVYRGQPRPTRTGVLAYGNFGGELVHDLSDGFPLFTTKYVPFKSVIAELVGFLKGVTSAADFRQLGTKIWDQNANENESWLGNPHRVGTDDLGPIYGAQWRRWESVKLCNLNDAQGRRDAQAFIAEGYKLVHQFSDGIKLFCVLRKEIDQLAQLISNLKNDPYSRYHIVTAWNPGVLSQIALPACHMLFQCYVRDHAGPRYLDLHMYQRSADLFLGVPFNMASYAALNHALCQLTGYLPGRVVLKFGDVHVYENHVEQAAEQLTRTPHTLPRLALQPFGTIDELTVDHFVLQNYVARSPLPAPMAV